MSEAAKGCCGGDTTATSCCGSATTLVAATTGGSINKVCESDTYNCNCLDTGNADADCGDCYEDPDNEDSECSGANTQSCATACDDDDCGTGGSWCNDDNRVGDFITYCPNDGQTAEDGCEGSGKICSKRVD